MQEKPPPPKIKKEKKNWGTVLENIVHIYMGITCTCAQHSSVDYTAANVCRGSFLSWFKSTPHALCLHDR